jgi:hypothetical protein
MTIPGSLPPAARALDRAAKAYGVAPKAIAAPAKAPSTSASDGLRAVLNEEEKAYFDQIAALGPITYGPGRRAGTAPVAPRGLRLDVTG